jgi:hypothetical protein
VRRGKLPREKDSVSFWLVWVGTSLVCLALAAPYSYFCRVRGRGR